MHSPLILYTSQYYGKSRLMFGLTNKASRIPSRPNPAVFPLSTHPNDPIEGPRPPSTPSLCGYVIFHPYFDMTQPAL